MKSIKVNADYEAVLFGKKESLPAINQALEFLALYVDERPLWTQKKYSTEFLAHVESFTGNRPVIKKEGAFDNWWGELRHIELEQRLNSKEMSTRLNIEKGWAEDTHIINEASELEILKEDGKYLGKNPYGMSGQNFLLVSRTHPPQSYPMIVEPLLDRVYDFSHYIFPNGQKICYQNIVDKRYQYRGTIFRNYTMPLVETLKFYSEIDSSEWGKFNEALKEIIALYQTPELQTGFSVDSFVYKEKGQLKIRFLSEVNYRRTMGEVAFRLSLKFGGVRRWSMFLLTKKSALDFHSLKEKIKPLEWTPEYSCGVILLSPEDVRFEMYFLSATDEAEGKQLFEELKKLLPDTELTVDI